MAVCRLAPVTMAQLTVSLLLQLAVAPELPAQEEVRFNWFSYEGRDAIFEQPLPENAYRNPVIAGFNPDPSIVRVGDAYYLVTSSFAYFPGLPIYRSTDLVNWQHIAHAITRRSQLALENGEDVSRGIFAPTIRYHDGIFYIITTDVDGIGNFYITATDPAGPWSDPLGLPEIKGIDPDLFFDDDGRVYIAHNGEPEGEALYEGHRAIWLWEFDLAKRRVIAGSGRVIVNGGTDLGAQPIWIEAPHLYRVNGWYYLVCAEGGTADQHSAVVFRSRSLDGRFVPYERNPILTQRHLDPGRALPVSSTGHADFVQLPAGDWWAVFLATRPYDARFHNTGRETFLLPVHWRDGWPVILDGGRTVPLQAQRPSLQAGRPPQPPQSGNFVWRDDFSAPRLSPAWLQLRTSGVTWHRVDAAAGQMVLTAMPIPLTERVQPAYLGRRQQHLDYTASTELQLPLEVGTTAGIAAFQNADYHFFFAVRSGGAGHEFVLEVVRAGDVNIRHRGELTDHTAETVVLGIEQSGPAVTFYTMAANGTKIRLARDLDASLLSTQVAGGFVGTTLGMHARSGDYASKSEQ